MGLKRLFGSIPRKRKLHETQIAFTPDFYCAVSRRFNWRFIVPGVCGNSRGKPDDLVIWDNPNFSADENLLAFYYSKGIPPFGFIVDNAESREGT